MNTKDLSACQTCGELLSPEMVVCPRDGAHRNANAHDQSTQSVLPIRDSPLFLQDQSPEKTPENPPTSGPAAPSPDTMLGQRLGEYVVRQRLGNGGMGVVYAGEHVTLGSKVAIKFILEEHARGPHARDLLNEARAASAIRHHGIIDVFGFGQQPNVGQFLVMEYLEGRPLNDVIQQRAPLAPSEALPLLCEVLDALSAAHAVGVIHRDLKPSNIFVVRQSNGSEYIKVLDFGLAKRSSAPDGTTPQTRSDLIVGTPQYMSPEQALCEAVSPQTDLYAVGVIAFELLTGQRPFTGRSHMEVVAHHIKTPPPAPSSLVSQAPELDALILRLLAKEPRQRPASASQVAAELRALLQNPLSRTKSPSLAVVKPSDIAAPHDRTATLSPSPETPQQVAPRPIPHSTWKWGSLAGVTLAFISSVGLIGRRTMDGPPPVANASPPVTTGPIPSRAVAPEPSSEPQPSFTPTAPLTSAPSSAPVSRPRSVEGPRSKPVTTTIAQRTLVRPSSPSVPTAAIAHEPLPPLAQSTPTPAATGLLHLSVRGAWADVLVDGQRLGRVPPQNNYPLTAGEHQLELRNPNLEIYRQRIIIPPHDTLTHPVDFTSKTLTRAVPNP